MQVKGYKTTARILHWSMAALVVATPPAGFIMAQQGIARGLQDARFLYHKHVGVLLCCWCWCGWTGGGATRHRPAPPLPGHLQPLQALMAHLSHGALYVLLLVMPIAGQVRVKAGDFPIETLDALVMPSLVARSEAQAETAKAVHFAGGLAIAVVISMHLCAAMLPAVVLRDGIFRRMWPPFDGTPR